MKHTFCDDKGREWVIKITVGSVREVRNRLGVNLCARDAAKILDDILSDVVMLVDIAYLCSTPQIDLPLKISAEEFGQSLSGESLNQLATAFMDAFVAFIPNPRDRARMGKLVEKARQMAEESQKILDKAVDQTLGAPSGSAPDSSA